MSDMFDSRAVPIHIQVAAAERELKLRRSVYPRRISSGFMTQALADREIANMEAIVETLTKIQKGDRP